MYCVSGVGCGRSVVVGHATGATCLSSEKPQRRRRKISTNGFPTSECSRSTVAFLKPGFACARLCKMKLSARLTVPYRVRSRSWPVRESHFAHRAKAKPFPLLRNPSAASVCLSLRPSGLSGSERLHRIVMMKITCVCEREKTTTLFYDQKGMTT